MRKGVVGTVLGLTAAVWALPSWAVGVSGQGTWETTLQPRDLSGSPTTIEAYYDTVLDITWLVDANYARTSGYLCPCQSPRGVVAYEPIDV